MKWALAGTKPDPDDRDHVVQRNGHDAKWCQDCPPSGDFTITDVVVPDLSPGIHSVEVEVSTGDRQTIALTSFEVLALSCSPPGSGDWIVAASCTFQGSTTAPANVIVEAGVALTIDTNASLDIDFTNFHLLIKSGSKVVIKDGGKIH